MGVDRLQDVRSILHRGDSDAALAAAHGLGLDGPLQLVGELVLVALDHNAPGSVDFAAKCAGALRARASDGDQELADAIDAAASLPVVHVESLRELDVDLEQLADLIDAGQDSVGGRLDLLTGEVWPEFAFEATFDGEGDDEDDPNRWLHVWPTGSRRAYDDTVAFTATRDTQLLLSQLETALEGRGAFRRFKNALFDWPHDREEWFVFSEDRRRGRAREWLADAGYRPTRQEIAPRSE